MKNKDFVSIPEFQNALIAVCNKIIASEQMLTDLDTIIGDGDHGFGMKIGFSAMKKELTSHTYETMYDLMWNAGLALIRSMGGTSGVIFGTLFIGGIDVLKDKTTMNVADFASYIDGGRLEIKRRGKVDRGDKTMYDALAETSDSLKASTLSDESFEDAIKKASLATQHGEELTRDMISKKGRSKNFRDKTLGHPDTGAVSTSLIFETLAHELVAQN